ncbi:MAG: hypothetical protein TECD_01273 [Hyphomicrobiaceae bacterium hypho_1]
MIAEWRKHSMQYFYTVCNLVKISLVYLNRATIVMFFTSIAVVFLGLNSARTMDNEKWYKTIFSQTFTNSDKDVALGPEKPVQLKDLRTSRVPLRSEKMLSRIDKAILHYRRLVALGGWNIDKRLKLLRPGDNDPAVPAIRRRLVLSKDIPPKDAIFYADSFHFDKWLEAGVKNFQRRHGLLVSGKLDRPTRSQISITPEARLRQLILNRKRIFKHLVNSQLHRYVLVNTASFQLEAVDQFEVQRHHRVIVGKPDRQTPEISATIKGLNFFPFWRVPDSVAILDLIPRLIHEPDYLVKERISVVKQNYDGPEVDTTYINWHDIDAKKVKFRQDPGPWNALGLVRINMPNREIVYLHDTPMKSLFKQRRRAFSAGCVRVENVFDFVSWILRYEPLLNELDEVNKIIEKTNLEQIRLKRPSDYDIILTRPIPVVFTYITAWVEDDSTVVFRPDIYDRDGVSEIFSNLDQEAPVSPNVLSP